MDFKDIIGTRFIIKEKYFMIPVVGHKNKVEEFHL